MNEFYPFRPGTLIVYRPLDPNHKHLIGLVIEKIESEKDLKEWRVFFAQANRLYKCYLSQQYYSILEP